MAQRKSSLYSYWKQASNGLVAHVYEHIASNYITSHLTNKGLYYIADFDHWAHTYGATLLIDFRCHSKRTATEFHKVLVQFQRSDISSGMAQRALEQIAAEYERPLMQFDESFVKELHQLHRQQWGRIDDLPTSQATVETSVNTVFSTPTVRFGRVTPKSFTDVTLHFEINEELYRNNLALKALGVLLIQAIALNLHHVLDEMYSYYDTGDAWDNTQHRVAYRTYLRFPRRLSISHEELEDIISHYLETLAKSVFPGRIAHLLRQNYTQEHARYFSLDTMNTITDGLIIGYKGWKSVADEKTIRLLTEKIKVNALPPQ